MELVSIAIPVYNGGEFLKETILNLLEQTYENIEIILVDDCSTDNTREIIEKIAKADQRIKYFFNEENLTLNKNLKKAINYCQGEYIAICGQDDLYEKNKIEILLNYLKKTQKDGVYAKVVPFYVKNDKKYYIEQDATSFVDLLTKNKEEILEAIYCIKEGVYLPMSQSALWKASVLKDLNYIRQKVDLDDWPILVKSFELYNIGFLNQNVAYWRQHEKANHNNLWWNLAISLQSAIQIVPTKYKFKAISRNLYFAALWENSRSNYENAFKYLCASLSFSYEKITLKMLLKVARRIIKNIIFNKHIRK